MEPENPAYQRQLTATRALIRGRLHLQLEAGKVALEAGDAAGARVHFLRALALSPTNATAVARLRDLEERRAVVVQAAKLRRLAERRARRARSEAAASTEALGAAGQERYYLETGISLFQEGDYDAAIIEIGKYRSSYPDDEQALWYWVEARRRRDGERVESPEAGPPPSKRPVHTPIDGNETEDRRSAAEATAVSGGGASDGASASPPATTAEAEPRNREAAQELYERGLRAYRTDMTEAIQLWEEALSRDPGHVQARLRLERAYKMRQNLERME